MASLIASILTSHGLRVGLYTSPHLIELRERFRIDGRPVDRDTCLRHGRAVLASYGDQSCDNPLTFFELTTVMAARIFAEHGVDVAVWEVGLGGRLDAVNAIEPDLTVITNIGLDHQNYLGDTVEAIASEKAALIRQGVTAVIAPQSYPAATEAMQMVEAVHVEGRPQDGNVPTARRAATHFLGSRWLREREAAGIAGWRWPGRCEHRSLEGVQWWLDGAHNPAGAARMSAWLQAEGANPQAWVIAAMHDKDLGGVFERLRDLSQPVYHAQVGSPREATTHALEAAIGRTVDAVGPARIIFDRVASQYTDIAVFGSLYLLGEWFAWAGLGPDDLFTTAPAGHLKDGD